jgi:hypothetical protein
MNNFATGGAGLPSLPENDETLDVTQAAGFEQFDQWMDEQLGDLVAKWLHAAAPSAQNATFKRGTWSMSPRLPK